MIKRLFIALLLWVPFVAGAKVPDEEDIKRQTLNPESEYYYPNLLMRYRNGDSTLRGEHYHYLYYGYAYQESYKPLNSNPDLLEMMDAAAGLNTENPDPYLLHRIITAGEASLMRDPFSPRVLNLLAYAYGAVGKAEAERSAYERLKWVLFTIEDSGDGKTQKSPMHILMFDHAVDLLNSYDLSSEKSRIISRDVEYIPLTAPRKVLGKKIKGYYFDYSRIYRNKPEGYVFQRERTWQFNNLKPRKYK